MLLTVKPKNLDSFGVAVNQSTYFSKNLPVSDASGRVGQRRSVALYSVCTERNMTATLFFFQTPFSQTNKLASQKPVLNNQKPSITSISENSSIIGPACLNIKDNPLCIFHSITLMASYNGFFQMP